MKGAIVLIKRTHVHAIAVLPFSTEYVSEFSSAH